MRRFIGYFLTFLLAICVVVPVVELAVPDVAEAQIRETKRTRADRARFRTRNAQGQLPANWSFTAWTRSNPRLISFPRGATERITPITNVGGIVDNGTQQRQQQTAPITWR